jgi:hypothetical protein
MQKIKKKPWTVQDIAVLKEFVSIYPENLQTAFFLAGINLDRTKEACCNQYYRIIPDAKESMFYLAGPSAIYRNKKIVKNLLNENTINRVNNSNKKKSSKAKIVSQIFDLLKKL